MTLVVRSSHLLLGWDALLDCNALNMIAIKMMTRLCLFSNDCMGGVYFRYNISRIIFKRLSCPGYASHPVNLKICFPSHNTA